MDSASSLEASSRDREAQPLFHSSFSSNICGCRLIRAQRSGFIYHKPPGTYSHAEEMGRVHHAGTACPRCPRCHCARSLEQGKSMSQKGMHLGHFASQLPCGAPPKNSACSTWRSSDPSGYARVQERWVILRPLVGMGTKSQR